MAQKKAKRTDRRSEHTNRMKITTHATAHRIQRTASPSLHPSLHPSPSGTLQTHILLGAAAGLVAGSDKPVNPRGG